VTIRVLLVDDHAVVRAGLAQLLAGAADIEVVGQAGDGAEAVALARQCRPDVVLMDLQMPGMDGVEATRRIHRLGAGSEVVVLTSFSDSERTWPRWTPARSATCSRTRSRRTSWTACGLWRAASRRSTHGRRASCWWRAPAASPAPPSPPARRRCCGWSGAASPTSRSAGDWASASGP
jgi:CheY-like chemotaxis protein